MADIAAFQNAVADYCSTFRHPDRPSFEIAELYDLSPGVESTMPCAHGWPDKWPHAHRAGVYGFFDPDGRLLYVGKASNLGSRLGDYVGYESDRTCRVKHPHWSITPRYVLLVAAPRDAPFEAPSLEGYLIRELSPPDNTRGKIRGEDFSQGVRGKYADRYSRGSNVIVLDPDVSEVFPDGRAVNEALRVLARSAKEAKDPAP